MAKDMKAMMNVTEKMAAMKAAKGAKVMKKTAAMKAASSKGEKVMTRRH